MKLEAKDFRIGNLIECDNIIIEVQGISKYYVNGFDKANNIDTRVPVKHSKGIPLTEEWLIKFGFEKGNYKEFDEKHFVEKSNTIKVIISGVGFWDVYTDYNLYEITFSSGLNIITDNNGINHVHQLQNLYYAITGEELTIKNQQNDTK